MAQKKKMKPISFERQMNSLVRINDAAILDEEGADYIKLKIKLTHSWFAKVIGFLYRLRDYKKHLLTGFNAALGQGVLTTDGIRTNTTHPVIQIQLQIRLRLQVFSVSGCRHFMHIIPGGAEGEAI